MALFNRNQQDKSEAIYTVDITYSMGNTKLIIGLGNPEAKYDLTRHNIGFYCVDSLVEAENGTWSLKKALKSHIADLKVGSTRILVCKPTTFMNLSGEAVQLVQNFYKISIENTIIVHDEIDIPFGQIRTRLGGGSAGHNGIKSIIQHSGEDFGRVRVGIGNKQSEAMDSADFVLKKFDKTEQNLLKLLSNEVTSIINEAVFGGTLPNETRKFI